MVCPFCHTSFAGERIHGVSIDRCLGCAAVWFDMGELTAYRTSHAAEIPAQSYGEASFVQASDAQLRPCPKCKSKALRAGLIGDFGVSRCDSCQGVLVRGSTLALFPPISDDGLLASAAVDAAVWSLPDVVGWLLEGLIDGS